MHVELRDLVCGLRRFVSLQLVLTNHHLEVGRIYLSVVSIEPIKRHYRVITALTEERDHIMSLRW